MTRFILCRVLYCVGLFDSFFNLAPPRLQGKWPKRRLRRCNCRVSNRYPSAPASTSRRRAPGVPDGIRVLLDGCQAGANATLLPHRSDWHKSGVLISLSQYQLITVAPANTELNKFENIERSPRENWPSSSIFECHANHSRLVLSVWRRLVINHSESRFLAIDPIRSARG